VRSVSRELYQPDKSIQQVKKIVSSQQEFLLELLTEHKAEVGGKIQAKTRWFASMQIEKQFQINLGFKDQASKIQIALQAGEVQRAPDVNKLLLEAIEQHKEDLNMPYPLDLGSEIRKNFIPDPQHWPSRKKFPRSFHTGIA
jgi:hypothetical protein